MPAARPARPRHAKLLLLEGHDKEARLYLARVVKDAAVEACPEGKLRSSDRSGRVLSLCPLIRSVSPRLTPAI